MIVDHERFIAAERPDWEKLDSLLAALADDPWGEIPLDRAREMERLYQRASADLARLSAYAAQPQTLEYLEGVVARAYALIHGQRRAAGGFRFGRWIAQILPATFRRRWRAFALATALCGAGGIFGAGALLLDPAAKAVMIPFGHLQGDPAERVAREERERGDRLRDRKAQFSGMLMTHNTKIALLSAACGASWGIGTALLVFYNGVILGAVAADYLRAKQGVFLMGWLLPHGSAEIPALLIGAQAGFVLAGAMVGRGAGKRLPERVRAVAPDFTTLCFGAALMLVWAGMVEAFFSQYHEPVLPYAVKIAFGAVEFAGFASYYALAGRRKGVEASR